MPLVHVNTSVRNQFCNYSIGSLKISDLLVSREREKEKSACTSSRQRSKHKTESLAGKHQYFPRTARATNTHSIGYRWQTTRMRRWRLHSSALHDARANGTPRRGEREAREKESCEGSVRGGFRFELHEVERRRCTYTLTPPSFTRGMHASRSYETRTRQSGVNGTRYPYSYHRHRRVSSGSSITIVNASYEIVARFKPSR